MYEPQSEQKQPKQEASGIWVLLAFVVLLAIVLTVAVATQ